MAAVGTIAGSPGSGPRTTSRQRDSLDRGTRPFEDMPVRRENIKIETCRTAPRYRGQRSSGVLAAAPGTWPVGPTFVTIFLVVFVLVVICMAVAYFRRRT